MPDKHELCGSVRGGQTIKPMKMPAIFLSFDDQFIPQWHSFLDFFERYNIKATFYVSLMWPKVMTWTDWRMLWDIWNAGHTVGYHGKMHLDILKACDNGGIEKYIKEEIEEGLEVFESKGFNMKHFAYPYGIHSEETHSFLLEKFDTLRLVSGKKAVFYTKDDLKERKVVTALNGQPKSEENIGRISRLFHNLPGSDKATFIYLHNPDILYLSNLLLRDGLNFYPMSELDRC